MNILLSFYRNNPYLCPCFLPPATREWNHRGGETSDFPARRKPERKVFENMGYLGYRLNNVKIANLKTGTMQQIFRVGCYVAYCVMNTY